MAERAKDWADEEPRVDTGRRRLLQATLVAGAVGAVTTLVASAKSIIPPPLEFTGTIEETFRFSRPDNPALWYAPLANRTVRLTDFALWQGAQVIWRQVFDEWGDPIPGTGYPAILVCVEDSLLETPPEIDPFILRRDVDGVPAAFVGLYARCVHFCCKPGWHMSPVPETLHDFVAQPRTLLASDADGNPDPQDPIWCQCHNSMYDPVTIVAGIHPPPANVPYIGARYVHGPATRALPCIPMRVAGDTPEGIYEPDDGGHPEWYSSYCR